MIKSYKLTDEIKMFIILQKKADPKLSCRALAAIIKEYFQINLSKSLINNVIKGENLSGPVGRSRVKEAEMLRKPAETPILRPEVEFMEENGGFFFLKAADLKLNLTVHMVEILSAYFPGLSLKNHQATLEALIYSPLFKDKKSLWLLIGKEISEEALTEYSQQLLHVPFLELKESLAKLGIDHNFNGINGLCQRCLLQLNAYIVHSFPPEYQFSDFLTLKERFYALPAKLERKSGLLAIQLFYPRNFLWINDVIWQEGFAYAANRINEAKIFTQDKEQIWLNPKVQFPEGNVFSSPPIFP